MDILIVHLPAPFKEEMADHVGLGYIASVLRSYGFSVTIIDGFIQQSDLEEVLNTIFMHFKEHHFFLLGFSIYQKSFEDLKYAVSFLRSCGVSAHITAGGQFPTMASKEVLDEIYNLDSICRGECEYVILELALRLKQHRKWHSIPNIAYRDESGEVITNDIETFENINQLPYPARDTIEYLRKQGASIGIARSRGCWGACLFCSISAYYKHCKYQSYRTRDSKDVVDEIEYTLKRYNYNKFRFLDDVFIGSGQKGREDAFRVANEIVKRKLNIRFWFSTRCDTVEENLFSLLKRAGLIYVYLGLESWSDASLRRFNKKISSQSNLVACNILNKLGIDFQVGFIMFEPYSTLDDIRINLRGIKRYLKMGYHLYRPENMYVRIFPFWGTPLVHQLEQDGLLIRGSKLHLDYHFKYGETQALYDVITSWRNHIAYPRHLYRHLRMLRMRPSTSRLFRHRIKETNGRWSAFQLTIFERLLEYAYHQNSPARLMTNANKLFKDLMEDIRLYSQQAENILTELNSENGLMT